MTEAIILTHYFVRSKEENKLPMIEFSIEHCRKNNPNSYIILAGHGLKPDTSNCDHVIWDNLIDENELGMGHPKFSYLGLDHLHKLKIKKALKTTSYSIFLHENYLNLLNSYLKNKKLLITQETEFASKRIGDLFIYGDVDILLEIYDYKIWQNFNSNGLDAFGYCFDKKLNLDQISWPKLLNKYCSFENIFDLKWIDLRVHWHKELKNKKTQLLNNFLENSYNYLWGHSNGKNLIFDDQGKILKKGSKNWIDKDQWIYSLKIDNA